MKTLTSMATLVLLTMGASAQFQMRYSTPNYDWPAALDLDREDGYIVAGQTLKGTWYPLMMRVKGNGSLLWSYAYNLAGILTNVSQVVDIQLQSEVVRCDIKLMN